MTRPAAALRPGERGRLAGMAAVIVMLNGAGWGLFVLSVLPHHFRYERLGVGLGVAVTAWTLGLRHAFDADHISAIDNVTRKLMSDGKRPLGTGFCFALGHSTVIVVIGAGIALAARAVFGAVVDPGSTYETLGGMVGTLLAAGFLYLIAALNLVVLAGIVRIFSGMRHGRYSEAELERQLQARGLMYRFFGRFMRSINHTWQMFLVGLAFGIGFDTATEVVLLTAAVYAATSGLPFYAVLALPLLFAGGMTLFDTLDGCFMNIAYGWAFARPVRKVYYNLVITGLSIAAAFLIGTVELCGLLAGRLGLHGSFWDFVAGFDINKAGFTIAALFVVVWACALAVWRFGRVESRWQSGDPPVSPE
jgi:nickel/cobalt transporter (NiCoT) family protein